MLTLLTSGVSYPVVFSSDPIVLPLEVQGFSASVMNFPMQASVMPTTAPTSKQAISTIDGEESELINPTARERQCRRKGTHWGGKANLYAVQSRSYQGIADNAENAHKKAVYWETIVLRYIPPMDPDEPLILASVAERSADVYER